MSSSKNKILMLSIMILLNINVISLIYNFKVNNYFNFNLNVISCKSINFHVDWGLFWSMVTIYVNACGWLQQLQYVGNNIVDV